MTMTTPPRDDFGALVGTISETVRRERVAYVRADTLRASTHARKERRTLQIAVGLTVAAAVLLAFRWDAIVNPRSTVTDFEIDRALRARVAEVAARIEGELAATGRLPASLAAIDLADPDITYAPEPDGHYAVSATGPSGIVRYQSSDDLSTLFPARGVPEPAPAAASPAAPLATPLAAAAQVTPAPAAATPATASATGMP